MNSIMLSDLIAFLFCLFLVTPLTAAPLTLDITEFGARPNSGSDVCAAIKAALDKAGNMDRAVTIRFPRGRYDFFKQQAEKANYKVSGIHHCWDFTIAIHMKDQQNLTIDGDSSLFLFHGELTPFAIVNCDDVLVRDLIIDHVRPTVSEFQVLDKGEDWVDVRIHPDSKYRIAKNGEFWWVNADGESFKAGTAQWFDPAKDITRRSWDPSLEAIRSEQSAEGMVRFYFDREPDTQKGLIYQTRFPIRKNQGALIYRSQNIEWRNVTVRFSPGLGFLGQFSKNLTFQHIGLEPDPQSGRTCASFADGIHLCGCSGTIIVRNCRLVGLQDDHMNIYGNLMVVDRKNKATGLLAFFSSDEQRCDTSMFSPGDRVVFRDPATLLPLEENTVVKTDWAENERFMITMEKEIRGEVTGSFLENRTKIPDLVEIQGNYLGRVPTRSILMYASMKSIIENNILHRSQMPAILIKTPDPPYHLQGVAQDLTIRNNVFFECGDLAERAVIAIDPQVSAADYKKPVYQQVKIVDNLFITREIMVPLLRAGSTHGIIFSGNRVESGETDETLLSFTACAGVVIINNLIFNQSRPFRIDFIHSSPAELRLDPVQDWIINKVSQ